MVLVTITVEHTVINIKSRDLNVIFSMKVLTTSAKVCTHNLADWEDRLLAGEYCSIQCDHSWHLYRSLGGIVSMDWKHLLFL